jgi:carbamate kinase
MDQNRSIASLLGERRSRRSTSGLFLTGGGTEVFNTNGGIDGVEGVVDQIMAAEADTGV